MNSFGPRSGSHATCSSTCLMFKVLLSGLAAPLHPACRKGLSSSAPGAVFLDPGDASRRICWYSQSWSLMLRRRRRRRRRLSRICVLTFSLTARLVRDALNDDAGFYRSTIADSDRHPSCSRALQFEASPDASAKSSFCWFEGTATCIAVVFAPDRMPPPLRCSNCTVLMLDITGCRLSSSIPSESCHSARLPPMPHVGGMCGA